MWYIDKITDEMKISMIFPAYRFLSFVALMPMADQGSSSTGTSVCFKQNKWDN